jgi:hypothetical protein
MFALKRVSRHSRAYTHCVRFMGGASGGVPSEDESKQQVKKNMYTTYIALGSGAVVLYGITTGALDLMYGFMSLTPAQTAYYGLMAGTLSTGSVGLCIGLGMRNTAIDPLNINRWAINLVNKSTTCKEAMAGPATRIGDVYAASQTHGYLTVKESKLTWMPATVDMTFDVQGPSGRRATVGCSAARKGIFGQDEMTFVGMVGHAAQTTPILVKGVDKFSMLEEMSSKVKFA